MRGSGEERVLCLAGLSLRQGFPRLPGAFVPSADKAAALLLLASEAWVGVSRRLRTPSSTVPAGGLRATRPPKDTRKKKKKNREGQKRPRRTEWMRMGGVKAKQKKSRRGVNEVSERSPCDLTSRREQTNNQRSRLTNLTWAQFA